MTGRHRYPGEEWQAQHLVVRRVPDGTVVARLDDPTTDRTWLAPLGTPADADLIADGWRYSRAVVRRGTLRDTHRPERTPAP